MRILLTLVACLWLAPTTALAQEPEAPGSSQAQGSPQENVATQVDGLFEAFHATRDVKKRREVLGKLVALGLPAFTRVETRATELKAGAKAARKAAGDDPDPATLETLRKGDARARAAAKFRDGVYMAIVVAAFEAVEKKHKNLGLIYAGQFSDLKRFGARAAKGSILLMKDLDIYDDRYRYKAWEVLTDLQDRSVVNELKEIATDYLMEDPIRQGAVSALSALGDTELLDKKIRELENEMKEDPRRGLTIQRDIANLCHYGRQYERAAMIQTQLIRQLEGSLKEHAAEMQKAQIKPYKELIANLAYNAACALSLAKSYPKAYVMLAKSLQADSAPAAQLQNVLRDGDLANLRSDKGFKAWFENASKGKFSSKSPGAPATPPKPEESTAPEKAAGEEKKPAGGEPAGKAAGEAGGKAPAKGAESTGGEPTPKSPPPADGGEDEGSTEAPTFRAAAADLLIDAYLAADAAKRKTLVRNLHATGPAAVTCLAARRAAAPEDAALAALDTALAAELVLAEMRRIEKDDPEGTLTFAGQFNGLKHHGKRAVRGALAVLKDDDLTMQHRRWAADALGDLGDKSVIPELRKLAEDYLRADEIQEASAFAMAALGDTTMLDLKIRAHQEAFQKGSLVAYLDIARIQYRGRAYHKAVSLLRVVTDEIEGRLASHGAEMEDKNKSSLRSILASTYYSLACNLALCDKVLESFEALDKCLAADDENQFLSGILRDGDLRTLRQEIKFKPWYAEWQAKKPAGPKKSPKKKAEPKPVPESEAPAKPPAKTRS